MRTRNALLSIVFSLLYQILAVVSGFVIPRIIIGNFGSDVNGLVNSITSFIGYIQVLQLGVGSVIKASMYKPLAKKNKEELSVIIKTTKDYFSKIGLVSIIYIIILAVVYPLIFAKEFHYLYTATLVIIIGLSTVFEYLYGITYQMLLEADQKSYVFSFAQSLTIIVSTLCVVIAAKLNCSVHTIKLITAMVFVMRPILVCVYTEKKYTLNREAVPDPSVIAQRWDGFAQGMAYFIHSKTDIFVLTAFSTLSNVSVYSVYALVTTGLNSFLTAIDKAVRSAIGNILANDEQEHMKKTFEVYNSIFHLLCSAIFSTAIITVFEFIRVYVQDVSDTNYINVSFGLLIITAEYIYCLRMPYNSIIFAAGKFKETRNSAFVEAIINVILSCVLVFKYGLIGVAIGTLCAMIYRTVSFIKFLRNNIIYLNVKTQIKRYFISFTTYFVLWIGLSRIKFTIDNFGAWIIYAGTIFAITLLVNFLVNYLFDNKNTKIAISKFIRFKK